MRWPWARCFSFTREGSVVLDDENVPCLEPFSEIASISSVCDESRRVSKEFEPVSPISGAGVSCCRENCYVREGKCLNEAIRKQSNKNYSSFDPSPPIEKFNEFVTSDIGENLVNLCDERKPLLVGASPCATDEITSGKTNDLNSSVEKEIYYDKIIPLPITTKDLNRLKDYGTDNFGYDVDSNHIKTEKSVDKAIAATKETVVLCNDLDSVCQVIPLSFSPNLYPDVGSVPLINCQASRKSALPSHNMFSSVVSTTDDNSDSYVTVLSRTGNRVRSAASWPRRRPQSLRVAICYSSPECRQEVCEPVRSPTSSQEISMREMSHGNQDLNTSSSTTSFLKTWGSLENLETSKSSKNISGFESSFSQSQPDCSKLDDFFQVDSGSKLDLLTALQVKDKCFESDIPAVLADVSDDLLKMADSVSQPLVQSSQINTRPSNLPQVEMMSPIYASYLMSPSSDKENDPALLSVRPKVKQSPRRKKNSPKKKNKSPKKSKLSNAREEPNKLPKTGSVSGYGSEVPVHSIKGGNFDDDVWAVDDFLPLPKNRSGNSLPNGMQDFEVCNTQNFKSPSLQSLMPENYVKKSSPVHSNEKEFESSMVTSTFSTDTGYETETTKSEKDSNLEEKVKLPVKQSLNGSDTKFKLKDQNPTPNASNYSLATSLELTSEATTPHTVADDITEYYSIASELSNAQCSTRQSAGEDTPDYLSICSEMPGVPRLLEDSPMVDFEMNQLFPEECKHNDLLPSPLDSPESGEPSTFTDTPITVAKSVVEEDLDEKNSPEHKPSDGSNSATPSLVESSPNTPDKVTSQELVEVKYVQLSLSIVLAIVLHAMQSISQFMLEIFLATEHEGYWD